MFMPSCYFYLHNRRQWSRPISKGSNLNFGSLKQYSLLLSDHAVLKVLIMHFIFSILRVRDNISTIYLSCKNLTEIVFSLFYCIKIVPFLKGTKF